MVKLWLLALAVTALASEEREPAGWIVGYKAFQSTYAVEGMDYVIEYGLFNVGDRPATKVTLDDRISFPTTHFDVLTGHLNVRFERILPKQNISHTVILRPKVAGVYNYTAAQITYRLDENSKEIRVGLTTAPESNGYVYRMKEYERKFAPKYPYWLVFFCMIAPATLGSFYAFAKSKAKYDALTDVKSKPKTN